MFKRFVDSVFRKPMVMSTIQAMLASGQFQAASDKVEELIAMAPEDGEAYRVRGQIRYGLKDLDGALADIGEALEKDPHPSNVALCLTLRGMIQLERGEQSLALADFSRAIATSPAHSNDAFTQRGKLHLQREDYPQALEDFSTALRFEIYTTAARRAELHRLRADTYLKLKDEPAAIDDLLRSRAYNPADTRLNLQLVNMLMERGDHQMALIVLNDAIKFDPGNASQYDALREKVSRALGLSTGAPGVSDPGAGGDTEAPRPGVHPLSIPQAYQPRPQPQEASYSQRAMERAMQGDLEGALEDVDLALKNNPNNAHDMILRGNICFGLGKYDGALASFRRVQTVSDRDMVDAGLAGEALTLYMFGDVDDARAVWARLVERDPIFKDLTKTQNRLRWADQNMEVVKVLLAPPADPQV
jgi:tetratricopeptide (TPR) repeat protein